ncbi:hypothetical protein WSM22_03240 [Cytophagales bacterium WSM2-2]|nr:hypothetical protein WSM22_03240 [Cytophagales bacterium WSM2-2]
MGKRIIAKKLREHVMHQAFADLDEAIEVLLDSYNMERTLNELHKGLKSELEYYEKELEVSELFNLILQLKQIKNLRQNGKEN